MNTESIANYERRLGCRLPDDYRNFLASHSNHFLDQALVFNAPRSGIIDELLTVEQLLENDRKDCSGIPDKHLLHIGGNLMGGYLYMKVSDSGFGQVHYMENLTVKEVFETFSVFIKETHNRSA
jgi:hypothetical protein